MAGSILIPLKAVFDDKGIRDAQRSFGRMGSSLRSALGAVGITASLAGIVSGYTAAAKAAVEDGKSQALLAQQLRNTIGATDAQIASAEQSIKTMMLQASVADDVIRPAFAQLTRATGDVTKATSLTSLALDVSAGTGRDLNAVAIALSKAYQGNTTALSRLGIKAKEGVNVFDQLKTQFNGSAEAAAKSDPYQRFTVVMQELQETIGVALLPALNDFADWFADSKNQESITNFAQLLGGLGKAALDFGKNFADSTNYVSTLLGILGKPGSAEALQKAMLFDVAGAMSAAKEVTKDYGSQQKELYNAMQKTKTAIGYQTVAVQNDSKAKATNTAATKASTAAQKANSEARIKYWQDLVKTRELLQAEADALAEAQQAMRDATAGIKTLMDTSVDMGEYESRVVDTFTNIKDVISSSLADGKITRSAAYNLSALADSTQASIQAIAKQRDALIAKRSLVEALIGDVKGSLMGAGNLTGLLETQSKTVTKTVTSIVNGLQVAVSSTTEEITSGGLLKNFKSVLDKTKAFASQLKELRKLGLDQNLFKQIVDAGAEGGGALAAEIIAGGADAVKELNSTYKDLADVSGQIAEQTAVVMYNDGKDVVGGLVAGLVAQEQQLKDAAMALANAFLATFNSMMSGLKLPSTGGGFTQSDITFGALDQAMALSGTSSFTGEMRNTALAGLNSGNVTNVAVTVNAGVGTNGKAVGQAILEQINTYKAANGGSF